MSTKVKIKNEMFTASPDKLDFSVPNPRFAGIDYYADDLAPYGDAIDKMYSSMIETYKKTGSLLLQPIIVESKDDKYVVRAGYTRAMTFVHRYEHLCKELECAVEIPVYVMDGINIVDSLTENVVRSQQHYITLAHAIRQAVAVKGVTIAKIASQLGISVNRATSLRKIAALPQDAIKLCFDNVISENGAAFLASYPDRIQRMIIDEIFIRDLHLEGELIDQEDIERLSNMCMPVIDERVPVEEFTDLEGNYHPHITKEPWYINVGSIFDSARTYNEEATRNRSRAYWEKFVEDNNIKIVDRYDVMNWHQCNMGTHPDEVACWDYSESFINFFVKPSALESINNSDERVEQKQNDAIERVNRKITSMKQQARKDVVFRLFYELNQNGCILDKAILHLLKDMHINGSTKEALSHLFGEEISNGRDLYQKCGSDYALTLFLLSNLMTTYSYTPSTLAAFFSDNGVDIEAEYNAAYVDVEAKRAELMERAVERAEEIGEDAIAKREFVTNMCYTVMYDTGKSIYNSLDDCDEHMLQFICKNLGVSSKGSVALTRLRTKNLVNSILDSINADADTDSMIAGLKMVSLFNEKASIMFNPETTKETLNGTDLNNDLRDLASTMREFNFVNANAALQTFDIKGIIKSSDNEQRKKAAFVSFFTKIKDSFNFKVAFAYKNDKNKYQVI